MSGSVRWPVELILIAITLGALAVGAIAVSIGEVSKLLSAPLLWASFAAVAVLHSVAFVLLLLRVGAARHLIAAIACGWGLVLLLQLHEARSPGEMTFGIALVAALLGIAAYMLWSRRIRSVLV